MTEKINWRMSAQVVGGTVIFQNEMLDVEIFDSGNITIDGKVGADRVMKEVNMMVGSTENVQLIFIVASDYDNIKYKLDGTENSLDYPLMLLGPGAAKFLGANLNKITFYNDSPNDVSIKILIGRKA